MDLSRKNALIVLFSVLIFIFIINLISFKNGHDWGDDFAAYIYAAKSLVNGNVDELYSYNKFRYENSTYMSTGGLHDHWGFPLILSPVYYFFGLNIYAMKVCVNLFFIFSLPIIFFLFRGRLSNLQNLVLVVIIAVNPWFFDFKDNVLSDIPFFFFSLISLYLIDKFIIEKKIWINKFISYSLIGIFVFLPYLIRSIGLSLLPTLMFVQFIENRSAAKSIKSFITDKINYIPYIIFIILNAVILLMTPGGATSSYFNNFLGTTISRVIYDIKYYSLLPSRFFPFLLLNMSANSFLYNKFSIVLYSVIILFVFLGVIRTWKKNYMYLIYILIVTCATMTFSRHQGFRLIIPIFPFFLYFLFIGLSNVTLSFTLFDNFKHFIIKADYLFGFGMILISLFYISQATYRNITVNKTEIVEGPYTPNSIELFNYIKEHTDKNASIFYWKAKVIVLYAERKSFMAPDYNLSQIISSPADYVLFNKKEGGYPVKLQVIRKTLNCMFENDTFLFCSAKKTNG